MLFSKLREKLALRKEFFKPIDALENEISEIRLRSDVIAICPTPTGNSWQGVLTATLGLFPDCTLTLPQYYSQTPYTEKELKMICEILQSKKFRVIVFSGFPTYFERIISLLFEFNQARLFLLYHGSFSSNREDNATIPMLETILAIARSGKIHSLGFVKKGMAETLGPLINIQAKHIILKTPNIIPGKPEKLIEEGVVNIGVFTHDQYRKNLDNQVAAALLVENSRVHLKKNFRLDYLGNSERIKYHGHFASYDAFLKVLGQMDINLYVSFSECWGQVITESLSLGVPCLAAENSGIFDFDSELAEWLIVKEFDNSTAIAAQIKRILPHKAEIGQRGREYVHNLNRIAEERLNEWFND
jgi:glycosyltransferase involved in cell wall biosynthesis